MPVLKVEFFMLDQIYHRCVNLCSFTDAESLIHYTVRKFGRTHHIRSKIYNGDNLPSYRACHLRVSRLTNNLWSVSSTDWLELQDQF